MLGRFYRRSSFIKEWNKQSCWKGRLDSEKNKINFGNEINHEENLCIEIVRMEVLIQRGRSWSNTMIWEPLPWISEVQRWIWYLCVNRSKTQQWIWMKQRKSAIDILIFFIIIKTLCWRGCCVNRSQGIFIGIVGEDHVSGKP